MQFFSKWKNLRLIIKPTRKTLHAESGEWVINYGHGIEFQDGIFETEDDKEIQFLKNHKYFDNIITTFNSEIELNSPKTLLKKLRERIKEEQARVPKIKYSGKGWICSYCNLSFDSGFKLGIHKKTVHADEIQAIKELSDMGIKGLEGPEELEIEEKEEETKERG